jgi:hypothetical protein
MADQVKRKVFIGHNLFLLSHSLPLRGLVYDATSIPDDNAPNGTMNGRELKRIWKNRPWPNHNLSGGIEEDHPNLYQDRRCPGRDSNTGPPDYKSRELRLNQPARNVTSNMLFNPYFHVLWSGYRRGFGLVTGFIDHFNTQLITTLNYSAIADLRLHSSLEHTV